MPGRAAPRARPAGARRPRPLRTLRRLSTPPGPVRSARPGRDPVALVATSPSRASSSTPSQSSPGSTSLLQRPTQIVRNLLPGQAVREHQAEVAVAVEDEHRGGVVHQIAARAAALLLLEVDAHAGRHLADALDVPAEPDEGWVEAADVLLGDLRR